MPSRWLFAASVVDDGCYAERVRLTLLEHDERNVAAVQAAVDDGALRDVTVVRADAADRSAAVGSGPG
jgi:hypothetical protein